LCNLAYIGGLEAAAESAGASSVSERRPQGTESLVEAASFSATDLFKDLPAACVQALEKGSEVRDFRAGHAFFHPGETGQVLFLLEKGRVQTFRTSGTKKLIIADLKPPAVFGEMGCIGQCMYHCSAQTSEPSRIRTISRADLEALLDQYPVLTRRLLDLVSQRFVHVLLDLEATSFRHLVPRMARLLLERAEEDCIRDMTHKELAQHLGVHRESATAAIGELRKAGIIAVERKRIRIVQRARLERAARE
jgi:CRP/FNR family transcriptional regulator, cyclic AMP receptor protein